MVGQTNINTCGVSELIPEKAESKYICLNKILSKFVAKLRKYRILFKDKLTFLGLI